MFFTYSPPKFLSNLISALTDLQRYNLRHGMVDCTRMQDSVDKERWSFYGGRLERSVSLLKSKLKGGTKMDDFQFFPLSGAFSADSFDLYYAEVIACDL